MHGFLGPANIVMVLMVIILYGGVFLILISSAIRRLHDIGLTGWLSPIIIIPLLNILFALALTLWPGSKKPNRYGPTPPQNKKWMLPVAMLLLVIPVLMVYILFDSYRSLRSGSSPDAPTIEQRTHADQ